MTPAELVERAARAIAIAIKAVVEPDVRAHEMTDEELAVLSSSATRIALEEAAKVAEAHDLAIMSTTAADVRANEIAAAIRGLIGSGNAS